MQLWALGRKGTYTWTFSLWLGALERQNAYEAHLKKKKKKSKVVFYTKIRSKYTHFGPILKIVLGTFLRIFWAITTLVWNIPG